MVVLLNFMGAVVSGKLNVVVGIVYHIFLHLRRESTECKDGYKYKM